MFFHLPHTALGELRHVTMCSPWRCVLGFHSSVGPLQSKEGCCRAAAPLLPGP